ncbi:MAG: hypothetical protein KAT43_02700 [Nanoarchaeota archaeon]|nr:hypothetical protein [Nanoarchaeota archaeon]
MEGRQPEGALNIGKRTYGLYMERQNQRIFLVYQLTSIENAISDIVKASNALDAVQTNPGEIMTEQKALEFLTEISGDQNLPFQSRRHILAIKLKLKDRHFQYRGLVKSLDEKIVHDDLVHRELIYTARELLAKGELGPDTNALIMVRCRDLSSGSGRHKRFSSRILLATGRPVVERLEMHADHEIHRAQLLLSAPIFEYYLPKYHPS